MDRERTRSEPYRPCALLAPGKAPSSNELDRNQSKELSGTKEKAGGLEKSSGVMRKASLKEEDGGDILRNKQATGSPEKQSVLLSFEEEEDVEAESLQTKKQVTQAAKVWRRDSHIYLRIQVC